MRPANPIPAGSPTPRLSVRFPWRAFPLLLAALPLAALLFSLGSPAEARGGRPGVFDYYTLVLSWSPTYCASPERRRRREPQCDGPRPFAFVLHGLWPQYERGWPEYCRIGRRPWVPRRVIDSMLDIMPSPGLVIHEYKKHGVCTGLDAARYFALSRTLFAKITIPERFRRLDKPLLVRPGEVEAAFLAANPALTPEMISISCNRRKRLREVRICFSRLGKPRACGPNEAQRKLCRAETILMPPMRQGRQRRDGARRPPSGRRL